MARVETEGGADTASQGDTRPYSPSWVDHLGDWVERRPGLSWSYYLGTGVVLLSIQAIVLWVEGVPISGTTWKALAYLAAAIVYMLGLIHHLDKRAVTALVTMRPALKADEQEHRRMRYQLTNLPALATLLASLAAFAFVFVTEAVGTPYRLDALAPFPVSANLLRIFYLICWFVFGTFLYHTIHQLRVINHIYTYHTRIDLFRAKPLYAFSNLAALTAGSLAMISYGWFLANPWIDQTDPLVLIPMFFLSLFAVVAFVWPQMGIHRIQVAEKERLLDEASQRFEAAINELHRRMDDGELEEMTELNMAMASLEIEMNALGKTPTWPWEPEVLQLLVTALALPLGLWLIQLILQRTLGQ
ncbi:MAG TPA: hypothetical protein VLE70_02380 [Anaerolineae bacterium]|nr:hypothetical protein [Anaerolineae bacterium]